MSDPTNGQLTESQSVFNDFLSQQNADATNVQQMLKALWNSDGSSQTKLSLFFLVVLTNFGSGPFTSTFDSSTGYSNPTGTPDDSSISKVNGENPIAAAGYAISYLANFRTVVSDMQNQLNAGQSGGGSISQFNSDLQLLSNNFDTNIFAGSSLSVFQNTLADINTQLSTMSQNGWNSFGDLWTAASQGPSSSGYDPTKVSTAENMIQSFSNDITNLLDLANTQTTSQQTALQAAQGNLASLLAVVNSFITATNTVVQQTEQNNVT